MIDVKEYIGEDEILERLPEVIQEQLGIAKSKAKEQLEPIVNRFIKNIIAIEEYPYVDKYYRDTYYNFFSKKYLSHERDSIRVSFFLDKVRLADFVNEEQFDEIQDAFLGFITIRPTSIKIIGRSFISPKILKEKNFVCCLCREKVSICGVEMSVEGFPFCSQDSESIACAESALLVLTDYFSNKFSDYKKPLPSTINEILRTRSSERQLPSGGLRDEDIAFVLKELGFGTKIYIKNPNEEYVFKKLLYTYIESGIPVILTLGDKENNGHAVVAFGREVMPAQNTDCKMYFSGGINYFIKLIGKKMGSDNKAYFSDYFNKILVMNDNHTPYELVDYNQIVPNYTIESFIVPLHNKLHSDASLALGHLDEMIGCNFDIM